MVSSFTSATLVLLIAGCSQPADEQRSIDEINYDRLAMGMDWGGGGGGTTTTTPPTVTHLVAVSNDQMEGPLRMAMASDGSVWVTDPKGGAIHKISPTGAYSRSITTITRPLGIAIDAAGQLIVGDGKEGRVVFLDAEGNITGTVGAGAGEFEAPQDIAVDPATGDLWILDSDKDAVVRSTAGGIVELSFGSRGTTTGALHFPAGIAIDALESEVYVSDSNNGRVQVFDMTGTYKRSIGRVGRGSGKLMRTQGVALAGSERMFVADVFQGHIGSFETGGTFEGWVGSYGSDEGSLQLPSDLLYDEYGRLWVASYGTSRVEIYGIDDYTEPAGALPATAAVSPASFSIRGHGAIMSLYLDVPGSDVGVDATTVRVDGDIPIDDARIIDTDVVHDGATYEALMHFDRPSLQERYGEGTHVISVVGALTDETAFEGSFSFTLTDSTGDTGE